MGKKKRDVTRYTDDDDEDYLEPAEEGDDKKSAENGMKLAKVLCALRKQQEEEGSDYVPRPEYFETYFEVELPADGLPPHFGIVTACNPGGREASIRFNTEADAELRRCLPRLGRPFLRITGRSLDNRHREPGFGIVTNNPDEILQVSLHLGQEAFFWVEGGGHLLCHGCQRRGPPRGVLEESVDRHTRRFMIFLRPCSHLTKAVCRCHALTFCSIRWVK